MVCYKEKLDSFLDLIEDVIRLEGIQSYTSNNLDKRISKWTWHLGFRINELFLRYSFATA